MAQIIKEHKVLNGNPYSPVITFSLLDNEDREIKQVYPKVLFEEFKRVEKISEDDYGFRVITDFNLFEALSFMFDTPDYITHEQWGNYIMEIENKMNNLYSKGVLSEDIENMFFDEYGKFIQSVDFINIFIQPLCMYYNNETKSYVSGIYKYRTKDTEWIEKSVKEYLSDKYIREYELKVLFKGMLYGNKDYRYYLDSFLEISPIEDVNNKTKTYIATDETGLYKIGKSEEPEKRIGQLSCGNPTIKLCFLIDADVENELHKRFSSKRVSGEWFKLSEEDIDTIKSIIQ